MAAATLAIAVPQIPVKCTDLISENIVLEDTKSGRRKKSQVDSTTFKTWR
jgi:hypothetical protein